MEPLDSKSLTYLMLTCAAERDDQQDYSIVDEFVADRDIMAPEETESVRDELVLNFYIREDFGLDYNGKDMIRVISDTDHDQNEYFNDMLQEYFEFVDSLQGVLA